MNTEALDGLIIGGGSDISSEHYDNGSFEELKDNAPEISFKKRKRLTHFIINALIFLFRKIFSMKTMTIIDEERDKMEFSLIEEFSEKDKPILGICRGAQLINISFGGTLFKEIRQFYTEIPQITTVFPKKLISIKKHTLLSEFLQKNQTRVNALHHQSIKNVGKNLKINAEEENGIIQGIEHTEKSFLIGVQWHPEFLPQLKTQRKLFRRFITTAKKNS